MTGPTKLAVNVPPPPFKHPSSLEVKVPVIVLPSEAIEPVRVTVCASIEKTNLNELLLTVPAEGSARSSIGQAPKLMMEVLFPDEMLSPSWVNFIPSSIRGAGNVAACNNPAHV